MSNIIEQNTVGFSDGYPVGVPESYDWYQGLFKPAGFAAPPSDFTAVTGWGQVYQKAGAPAYTNANAKVEVANARTWVHLKATGEWVLVQQQGSSTNIEGGHFVTDFAGNAGMTMDVASAGSSAQFKAPPTGYNDHFWLGARGVYPAGAIDAVYVQMDMRVNDPNLHLVANIGADWWRTANAEYVDGFSNNPGAGMTNWVELSTNWSTLGFYSTSTAEFQADPPPALFDTGGIATPKVLSFSPDSGTVGDGVTSASVITLAGTAQAGSTVAVFDGNNQIGSATANASGAWSFATGELSKATHSFSVTAKDAAGNVSAKSQALNVTIEATATPGNPTTPGNPVTPNGSNLLVNGSFEATPTAVASGGWGGFNNIAGWTALTGGTIELWNNANGVRATNGSNFGELDYLGAQDGFYQDVRTEKGRAYDLSFDACSRPGFTSSTTTMEVLWNGNVVASVPPGSDWQSYHFKVVGTGGADRLTFREPANQGGDGLGALYDNVSLIATSAVVTPPPVTPEPPVTPVSKNLLVNGSFETTTTPVDSGRWAGFSNIPGWSALTGGTIELWNNLNGVRATNGSNFGELDYLGARDGFYQDVRTEKGKTYDLAFDARSRPGFTSSTTTMEVLWNGEVVASVPPGSDWQSYNFKVVGTGGADRLTFREAANQGGDGIGALYDNVSLVATQSAATQSVATAALSTQSVTTTPLTTQSIATSSVVTQPVAAAQPSVTQPAATGAPTGLAAIDRALDLMTQYSATRGGSAAVASGGPSAYRPAPSLTDALVIPQQV
jgi:hypothetical protein